MPARIINLQTERLRRLPCEPDDIWQGDLARMPGWLCEKGLKPTRLCMGIWMSRVAGRIGGSSPERPEDSGYSMVSDGLVQFASNPELTGFLPGRLEVRDAALAEHLRDFLGEIPIEVRLVPDLPELQQVIGLLARQVHGPTATSSYLDGEGVTLSHVRALAIAAAEFYASDPWTRLRGISVHVEAPRPNREFSWLRTLGRADHNPEVRFSATLRDLPGGNASDRPLPVRNPWSLSFLPITEIPLADADLWEDQHLLTAGERAYPRLLRSGAGPEEGSAREGTPERPDARALVFLEGLLRALTPLAPLGTGMKAWEGEVGTVDGSRFYRISFSRR